MMVEEIKQDLKGLAYWHKKEMHKKQFDRLKTDAYSRYVSSCEPTCIGDPIEWKSRNGNRWYSVFMLAKSYESNSPTLATVSFIYYDTYGSVGAFLPAFSAYSDNMEMEDAPTVFTSHFFLRYCERMGVKMRSRDMVLAFAKEHLMMHAKFHKKDENGTVRIDLNLKQGVGRGILINDGDVRIWEVRTFLAYDQLTRKQREDAVIKMPFDPMDDEHRDWFMYFFRTLSVNLDNEHVNDLWIEGIGRESWLHVGVSVGAAMSVCSEIKGKKLTMDEMDGLVSDENVLSALRELVIMRDVYKDWQKHFMELTFATNDLYLKIADNLIGNGRYNCRDLIKAIIKNRAETSNAQYTGNEYDEIEAATHYEEYAILNGYNFE